MAITSWCGGGCVTALYYHLFYYLEHKGMLNIALNEQHLFALHFVFKPRITEPYSKDGITTL